ncbi:MAG TPA: AraC family transcriptional regulator [Stellaceae bacterium]|nr:AraC family transcriptional regulator [Stellaceae bacterium]
MDTLERYAAGDELTIDFAAASASHPPGLGFGNILRLGSVTLAQCFFKASDGVHVGSSQVTVGIYDGTPFDMDWRSPDSDRVRSSTMSPGQAHIGDGRLPLWVRCAASPSFFAFAMDEAFVAETCQGTFGGAADYALQTAIGVEDPVLARIAALGKLELAQGGANGRLYVEGLGAALAVHLLRKYGASDRRLSLHRGGLTPAQLRRVIEYINTNLSQELTLAQLASVAGLSPHHFGQAFKAMTGRPPHRYVIEKRIHRARELLRGGRLPIAEIAHAVGFSSQSHLTINFRRLTGLTPARFRRSQI